MPTPTNPPYRAALVTIFDAELTQQLILAEETFSNNLREAVEARDKADQWIHGGGFDRPVEELEADLAKEYAELIQYHEQGFTSRLKALLEYWCDSQEG